MQLQLIRNATLRLNYGGRTFLIDPYFALKHTLPSFRGLSPNPMADLPEEPAHTIRDIEMVIVSHLHSDHFDKVAQDILPKNIPLFCQPDNDKYINTKGFTQVQVIEMEVMWQGITITRTAGQHGSGDVLNDMGTVSGFVFEADNEPTVYWAGDTIWYPEVGKIIEAVQPDIIITHSCGAVWGKGETLIVMDDKQTVTVCQTRPQAMVVAVHMETLDHSTITRAMLRDTATAEGIADKQLLIPADGEMLRF